MNKYGHVFTLIPERISIYECFYTGAWAKENDVKWFGATIPGVNGLYPCVIGCESIRKLHIMEFQKHEANCNTCVHFLRRRTESVKGQSGASSFIYGNCGINSQYLTEAPYFTRKSLYDEDIMLHASDPMHMKCHVQRGL